MITFFGYFRNMSFTNYTKLGDILVKIKKKLQKKLIWGRYSLSGIKFLFRGGGAQWVKHPLETIDFTDSGG